MGVGGQVGVGIQVGVCVGIGVHVAVTVGVGVHVAVGSGVQVGVEAQVGVRVGIGVRPAVTVGVGTGGTGVGAACGAPHPTSRLPTHVRPMIRFRKLWRSIAVSSREATIHGGATELSVIKVR
jgi:hypothetical protein